MTAAVCLKCGAIKHGALIACPSCQFLPEENLDKAQAMIVTDHYLSQADLEIIGNRVRDGLPVQFPEEAVQQYLELLEENPGKF